MAKLYTALLLALIYIILSLPVTFQFTDSILRPARVRTTFDNCPGLATVSGSIAHGILFAVIAYVILIYKDKNKIVKIEKFIHPNTLFNNNTNDNI